MKKVWLVLVLAASVSACSKRDALEIPAGSDVTVQKQDGVTVSGRLVEVKPEYVIVESNGVKTRFARQDIRSVQATRLAAPAERETGAQPSPPTAETTALAAQHATPGPSPSEERATAPAAPAYREVTIPAGTVLSVTLNSTVASDSSHVEDPVRGTVRSPVRVDGVAAIPAGTPIAGSVVSARQSARVKGRASIAFRFNRLDMPGDGGRVDISTATVTRVAPATKKQDAAKIGAGAAGGAIIGGIIGGGDGAAKGAAIGGGAGTAVVMSTRGKEVRLGAGTAVPVKLTAPVTVRVADR